MHISPSLRQIIGARTSREGKDQVAKNGALTDVSNIRINHAETTPRFLSHATHGTNARAYINQEPF